MAVGEQDAAQRGRARSARYCEVGDDRVDARHLGAREQHARVDEQQVPVPLEDEGVQAELAEAAERDQPNGATSDRASRDRPLAGGLLELRGHVARAPRTPQPIASLPAATPSMLSNLKCSLRLG